ncbi:MAG: aspartate carbamoyltransferase regulatory subunit [Oscillospiraceae bacterium]|nr:aspartate carbamoyltransferase regulatory subunit [Clostridiaceae bacterium]MDO4494514.1 aspartate carbamoyltransferase regulatory subunit [Clostridiaceae bacterium]MDY5949012.1 aspartate carbamoyltransferase regulatory subunit [Oscillospiraceae bacterium]
MNIDSIKNGVVIDHIKAGKSMEIYYQLELDKLDCTVAIIKNVHSKKMGLKDIIKIDSEMQVDLDALGYIDSDVTVNIIKDGVLSEKKHLTLPTQIKDVLKCRNPRCITTTEQDLPHIFRLTDPATKTYRCIYCESKAK